MWLAACHLCLVPPFLLLECEEQGMLEEYRTGWCISLSWKANASRDVDTPCALLPRFFFWGAWHGTKHCR